MVSTVEAEAERPCAVAKREQRVSGTGPGPLGRRAPSLPCPPHGRPRGLTLQEDPPLQASTPLRERGNFAGDLRMSKILKAFFGHTGKSNISVENEKT